MNQLSQQPGRRMSTLQIISIVFAVLSCAAFLIGSVAICLTWLRSGSNYGEANPIATILYLVVMLFFSWLLGTIALLTARRWVAAALILPITIVLFIAIYLFMVFISFPFQGGPEIAFLLLFIPLDALVIAVGWRFIQATRSQTRV